MNSEQQFWMVGVRGVRLGSVEPDAARAFYSAMTRHHEPRTSGAASKKRPLATTPFRVAAAQHPDSAPWTIAFGVTDPDAAVSACLGLGGRERASTAEDGWRIMEDPLGNRFAIVQAELAGSAPPMQSDVPLSDHYSRHAEEATAFYSAAFQLDVNIQADELNNDPALGDPIDYIKLSSRGKHLAGVIDMNSFADPAIPDQWIPYLHCTRVDAGIEQATALGAWVVVPQMETPTGRYALLQDPWGTLFGIWDARSVSVAPPAQASSFSIDD